MGKIPFLLLFPSFVFFFFFFHPRTRRPTLPPLLAPCWDHGFSRCPLKLLLLRSSMNSWQHLHAPKPSTWRPVLLAGGPPRGAHGLCLPALLVASRSAMAAGLQAFRASWYRTSQWLTLPSPPTYLVDESSLSMMETWGLSAQIILFSLFSCTWNDHLLRAWPYTLVIHVDSPPHLHNRCAFIINDGDSGPCGQMISLLLSCLGSPVWFLFQLFHGMITSSSE